MLRYVALSLLFWLTFRSALAQPHRVNSPLPAKIDSLQRLVTNPPSFGTVQVIQLHALARLCFMDGQFKRGLQAVKQAQAFARQLRYDKGEELFLQTLSAFSYTNSLFYFYDYQAGLAASKHPQSPADTTLDVSVGHPLDLDYAAINLTLKEALSYFTTERDFQMTALILGFMSANYRSMHQIDKSLSCLDGSIAAFQRARQPWTAYYLLAYKMRLLQEANRFAEAKNVEQLVNQFLTRYSNSRQAIPITYQLSWYYVTKNQLVRSYELSSKANVALERLGEAHLRPFVLENLGYIYTTLKAPKKALHYFQQAALLLEKANTQSRLVWMYNKIVFTLIALKRFDEAQQYITKAKRVYDATPRSMQPNVDLAQYYDAAGQRLMGLGQYRQALPNFFQALQIDSLPGSHDLAFYFNLYIAQCYQKLGNPSTSVVYGLKSFQKAAIDSSTDGREIALQSSQLLFENYQQLGQPTTAFEYLKAYYTVRQEIDGQNAVNRLAEMEIGAIIEKGEQDKARLEQLRLLKETENKQQRWWLFYSGAALISLIILVTLLYYNNQQKQQANRLLVRQKQEIDHQRAKADQALKDLKATQDQLIHQEKLASLGELTAGIAHEIQNPLNFVTNYSILSTDLVQQLGQTLFMTNIEGGADNPIFSRLVKNLQKITYHGERASTVVKRMLAHSRTQTSEYRLTNLNALVEEYTRLAYHGQRAKDVTFNCQLITELDATLTPVLVAPQEIGQVILNVLSNAFYAVNQQRAIQVVRQGDDSNYSSNRQPEIQVSTHQLEQGVEIRVNDNGTGMADGVKQKLFQPFYTTKPVGAGTGLGLSLSYDIVVKGHGGSLTVESEEGVGTTFCIRLPAKRPSAT